MLPLSKRGYRARGTSDERGREGREISDGRQGCQGASPTTKLSSTSPDDPFDAILTPSNTDMTFIAHPLSYVRIKGRAEGHWRSSQSAEVR
jgi:hypothetical protein